MENDWLKERLETNKNRSEIALLILENGRDELIHTELEDIYVGAQLLLDIYCQANPLLNDENVSPPEPENTTLG